MSLLRIAILTWLAVAGTMFSVSAQQPTASASLERDEGVVTLDGHAVAAGASATTLGNVADLQPRTAEPWWH